GRASVASARSMALASASSADDPAPVATSSSRDRTVAVHMSLQLLRIASAVIATPAMVTSRDTDGIGMRILLGTDRRTEQPAESTWSGCSDLNRGPRGPKPRALPG